MADGTPPQKPSSAPTDSASPTTRECREILAGLKSNPPHFSPRWFYDDLGSALFESITRLPEYYPTECELSILEAHGPAMGEAIAADCAVVELGCGSADKVARLLPNLRRVRAYHPIDVSRAALDDTIAELHGEFSQLAMHGLHGDFTDPEGMRPLMSSLAAQGPVLLFFPGSTIGNFDRTTAAQLMQGYAESLPPGSQCLLGVDLVKSPELLRAAYDDSVGVTAAFNRNGLAHINRYFGANFQPQAWSHEARWNERLQRIEMWLHCREEQRVDIAGETLTFSAGSGLHTENAHKWQSESISRLAHASGWAIRSTWMDENQQFAQVLLER